MTTAGVIANNVGSAQHREILATALTHLRHFDALFAGF